MDSKIILRSKMEGNALSLPGTSRPHFCVLALRALGFRQAVGSRPPLQRAAFALLPLLLLLASCATRDREHKVVISVPEQKMIVLKQGAPIAEYPVSTSKFGLGDRPGSCATPLGRLEVARKIGGTAPSGAVFKSRRATGEVLHPDAPGRDPIVSRILWLRGLDGNNRNAYGRCIYIHGTVEERNIGKAVSYGCIRMKSTDVIELYDTVGSGAEVEIINAPLESAIPQTGGVGRRRE